MIKKKLLPVAGALTALALSSATAPGHAADPADRQAFYGDLHLHTTNSFDAYVLMGTKTTPEEAYRFGRGDEIEYLGQRVRRSTPLDFMAVTDHSENLGVFNELDDPDSTLSKSELGKKIRKGWEDGTLTLSAKRNSGAATAPPGFTSLLGELTKPNTLAKNGIDGKALSSATWRRNIEATNKYYVPGKFTTFIGYEWTSMPSGNNLHRNVIFRGNDAPAPFSASDSYKPEDLWAYLAKIRGEGFEALAIPHNANASGGLMYDWTTIDGKPIDVAYSVLRAANEPVSEIAQNKGTSETHPVLSPTDEFANFEIFDRLLIAPAYSRPDGSYLRDALGKGLVLSQKFGVNPYKDGFVGAGDLHGGLDVSAESDFGGNIGGANIGGGRADKASAKVYLTPVEGGAFSPLITTSAALTGVWAEENTREAIYDALRRKETFATSGTRIKVRFFGGWDLSEDLASAQDGVERAYRSGVPQGGDLPAQASKSGAPSFVIWSSKDPDGANLDRAQVVKVWVAAGKQQEKIFDVAFEKGRGTDPASGKLAAIGNTVNLKTGKYSNTIGSAALSTVWTDPEFDTAQPAAYYVRVLEIPTPRWSTLLAVQNGLPLPESVPATIQERAWSSPIWYTPHA